MDTHANKHIHIQTIRTGSILRNQAHRPVAGAPGLKKKVAVAEKRKWQLLRTLSNSDTAELPQNKH